MFLFLSALMRFIIALFLPGSFSNLFAHHVILQKEVEILKRSQKTRLKFKNSDRIVFSLINSLSDKYKYLFSIIKPETVLIWQKKLIQKFWTFDNTPKKPGRPPTPQHIKLLVLDMKSNNLLWGVHRIEGELLKLGIELDHSTIARILQDFRKQGKIKPGLSWKKFLTMQAKSIFAMDFFTVDTITKHTFYVFFIIHHSTRQIIQFAITLNPTIIFVKQQMIEFEEMVVQKAKHTIYMIYDNGSHFYFDLSDYGITPVRTAIKSPNMNAIAERFIGSVRREALDYYLLLKEKQVYTIIDEYIKYYNSQRPHQTIEGIPKGYTPQKTGKIKSKPILGGLHHHYYRKAA